MPFSFQKFPRTGELAHLPRREQGEGGREDGVGPAAHSGSRPQRSCVGAEGLPCAGSCSPCPSELPCTTYRSPRPPAPRDAEEEPRAARPDTGSAHARSLSRPAPVEEFLCLTGRECQRVIPPADFSGDSSVTLTPP